ncbi:MAG: hypothetical protein K9G60_14705 [Pseudolabrys sp.]|nr:hypothetical protein [Pseudolabrys sp.]
MTWSKFLLRAAMAALFALSLTGCIDSSSPILADAEPVFGKQLRLQLYSLRGGFAHKPQSASYRWNGALYARVRGGMREFGAFSVHPFEDGDFIIQGVPTKRASITEYAVMHKLAEGVYQVVPIDEADTDEQTRTAYCKKARRSSCRIETQDQLFAFARATAARRKDDGGLVIRLPDAPERRSRRRRR